MDRHSIQRYQSSKADHLAAFESMIPITVFNHEAHRDLSSISSFLQHQIEDWKVEDLMGLADFLLDFSGKDHSACVDFVMSNRSRFLELFRPNQDPRKQYAITFFLEWGALSKDEIHSIVQIASDSEYIPLRKQVYGIAVRSIESQFGIPGLTAMLTGFRYDHGFFDRDEPLLKLFYDDFLAGRIHFRVGQLLEFRQQSQHRQARTGILGFLKRIGFIKTELSHPP